MLSAALYSYRLRKVGPEWPESAIGKNCAITVHAENCDFSHAARWACVSPNYGTGRTFHADESPSIPLWAVGCSDYPNDGPTGTRRVASHTIGEPIVSASLAMNTSTSSAIVDGMVAIEANPCGIKGDSLYPKCCVTGCGTCQPAYRSRGWVRPHGLDKYFTRK